MQILAETGLPGALLNSGVILGELNRFEEAVAAYDEVVARVGDAPEAAAHEQVIAALFMKAVMLGQLDRFEEAVAVYEEVVARFGDAPRPPSASR